MSFRAGGTAELLDQLGTGRQGRPPLDLLYTEAHPDLVPLDGATVPFPQADLITRSATATVAELEPLTPGSQPLCPTRIKITKMQRDRVLRGEKPTEGQPRDLQGFIERYLEHNAGDLASVGAM